MLVFQIVDPENGKMMKLMNVNHVTKLVKNVSDLEKTNVLNVMKILIYKLTTVSPHLVLTDIIQMILNGNVNHVIVLVLLVNVV